MTNKTLQQTAPEQQSKHVQDCKKTNKDILMKITGAPSCVRNEDKLKYLEMITRKESSKKLLEYKNA